MNEIDQAYYDYLDYNYYCNQYSKEHEEQYYNDMYEEHCIDELKSHVECEFFSKDKTKIVSKKISEEYIKNHSLEYIVKAVEEYTTFLPKETSLIERIYCFMNDIKEQKMCIECSKNLVNFKNYTTGYYEFCSRYCASISKERTRRIQETNMKKYGVTCTAQANEVKEKIRKTVKEKYGNNTFFGSEEGKQKAKEGMMKKFSCENPMHSQEIKERMKQNALNLHGKPIQFVSSKESYDKLVNYEKELQDFLKENSIECVYNTKEVISPKELDVYIPDCNLAIEIDGIYWHSYEKKKDIYYHYNKTKECNEKNIQLLHIFENEWIDKKELWKSIISSKLQKCNKIFARKCTIKELDNNTYKQFTNENHLQGYGNASLRYGLYYKDDLVSVMSFSKSRFSKKYEYELVRYCNLMYNNVIGGASKLLRHFECVCKPKSIVSYADLRYSSGNMYKKLGFDYSHTSKPNYYYFKNDIVLENRIKYQKHKLKDLLNIYNENLSEQANMINNGYNFIYDCGNLVYVKGY